MAGTDSTRKPARTRRILRVALPLLGAAALAAALLPSARSASLQSPPVNTGEPRILGEAVVGRTVTATNGSWTGTTPMSFTYAWRRCPRDGGAPNASNCGVIPDANRSSYRIREADAGFRLRVRVTARNEDGSATSTSNATAIVVAAAARPRNTAAPTIGGSPTVGQTLTANPGTWSGTAPISFGYQWRRCNANGGGCADIGGANGRTYTTGPVDVGRTLRVRVTARNSAGSESSTSAPTAVVTTGAPAGCPAGSGTVRVEQLSAPARLSIDQLRATPRVITRATGSIVARFHVTACQGRSVQGALVYAPTVPFNQFSVPPEASTGADGWATVTMERLRGFPAARRQQLLVMFARARKPGEPLLGGVSTRRLVSFPVRLSG
jgi:Ig domain of plant-specific actin-binding protein